MSQMSNLIKYLRTILKLIINYLCLSTLYLIAHFIAAINKNMYGNKYSKEKHNQEKNENRFFFRSATCCNVLFFLIFYETLIFLNFVQCTLYNQPLYYQYCYKVVMSSSHIELSCMLNFIVF